MIGHAVGVQCEKRSRVCNRSSRGKRCFTGNNAHVVLGVVRFFSFWQSPVINMFSPSVWGCVQQHRSR